MMYYAGVPIEEIRTIFGHEDTRTTINYIGLEFDNLSGAMSKYHKYELARIFPKKEILVIGQEKSGQQGIADLEIDWIEYQNFLKWKNAKDFLGRGYER